MKLPRSGSMPLPTLRRAIFGAPTRFRTKPAVHCRTILVRDEAVAAWVHLASVFIVGEAANPEPVEATIGALRLLSGSLDCTDFATDRQLVEALRYWHPLVDKVVDVGDYQSPFCYWVPSRNSWGAEPCWQVSINGTSNLRIPADAGPGPYFDSLSGFGATNMRALGEQWLGLRDMPEVSSVAAPLVRLIVQDHRPRIGALTLSETEVRLAAAAATEDDVLFARFECGDFDGTVHRKAAKLAGPTASFDPGRTIRELRVELWTANNELLDEFIEDDRGSTWGESVLNPGASHSSESARGLEMALLHGENEAVEFKPLVQMRDGTKRAEILETIVAFANRAGGNLYLGVNDNLEIVGTSKDLHGLWRDESSSLPEMRDKYERELKQVVGQAVAPSLILRTKWISYANEWVLCVEVPFGSDPPYSLVSNHKVMIRRGGNNVSASRADLDEIYRKRSRRTPNPWLLR